MESPTDQGHLPARTPEEISSRLYTLARKLDERLDAGQPISPETLRALARHIRSYALRLRAATPPYK